MKIKSFCLLLIVISFFIGNSLFADLNNGLVAYYPFSGNANDESGNSNHGTVVGATLTEDRDENATSAYKFDGIDDYIDFPETVFDESVSEFSFSTWVLTKDKDYSNEQVIIHKGNIEGESQLKVLNNYFRFGVKLSDKSWYVVDSESSIPKDTWVHLVGTYRRGNKVELWINGEFAGETSVPDSDLFTGSSHKSSIGAYAQDEHEQKHWDSTIDEVRIYNRALAEADILEIYGGPTGLTSTSEDDEVTLSWNPVPGASGYNIYYSVPPDDYTIVNTTLITVTDYTVTELYVDVVYWFYVTYFFDGTESDGSPPISVQVGETSSDGDGDADGDDAGDSGDEGGGSNCFSGIWEGTYTITRVFYGAETCTDVEEGVIVLTLCQEGETVSGECANSNVTVELISGDESLCAPSIPAVGEDQLFQGTAASSDSCQLDGSGYFLGDEWETLKATVTGDTMTGTLAGTTLFGEKEGSFSVTRTGDTDCGTDSNDEIDSSGESGGGGG
jgi:concanavalin A-like lectin/glucanase superfamily protein